MRMKLRVVLPQLIRLPIIIAVLASQACVTVDNIRVEDGPDTSNGSSKLTVMSFNIRMGAGSETWGLSPFNLPRGKALPSVIDAIRSVNPDIVGLQEVATASQARDLGKALNMNYAYRGHTGSNWWGVAILSKFPIEEAEGMLLSAGQGDNKDALIATVKIDTTPITFFSIHKDKDLYDGASFQLIVDRAKDIDGPVVLIGDLNVASGDWRLDVLRERFIDTAEVAGKSNIGTFAVGRIDYVWVDKDYFNVVDANVVSREHWDASDHLAYYAIVVLERE